MIAAVLAAPLLALPVLAPGRAGAVPLEPEACTALKTERQGLIADGVKADMDKGPDWAKANLAPERLGKIERLIAVEEQLSFRCDELVTAKPQMKEPPKPAKDQDGDKQAAANPTGDAANAAANPSAAPQKPARKKTAGKIKKKPAADAAD